MKQATKVGLKRGMGHPLRLVAAQVPERITRVVGGLTWEADHLSTYGSNHKADTDVNFEDLRVLATR